MTDIFLTGTFRNPWSKDFNLKLATMLEENGLKVFLPQRDSEQLGDRKKTFEQDVKGLEPASMLVAVGAKMQSANWGFEIGYAFKSGKPVIILIGPEDRVELMPEGASQKVIKVSDLENLDSFKAELLETIKSFQPRKVVN